MRNQSVAETITGEERLHSDTGGMLFRSGVCQTVVTHHHHHHHHVPEGLGVFPVPLSSI